MYKKVIAALALATLIIFVFYPIILNVGFLSDDWDLLKKSTLGNWWTPLEEHHFSPPLFLLFNWAAQDVIDPATFHTIALIVHCANAFLVWMIAHQSLRMSTTQSSLIAGLFAVNPAGLEAIVWCCSFGYVLSAFWVLLGLYIYFKYYDDQPSGKLSLYQQIVLITIQLIAFISWDWGILFMPIVLVTVIVSPERWQRIRSLIPLILFSGVLFLLKQSSGQNLGYTFNSPIQFAINIAKAPMLSLLPQFSGSFYNSIFGISIALALFLGIIYISWKNRIALLMSAIFFICQLPQALFSRPESRYFYLASFAIYFLVIIFLFHVQKVFNFRYIAFAYSIGIFVFHFAWAEQRIQLWNDASRHSEIIYQQISALDKIEAPIVIVNMPDRYGPENMIWLPYIWRNGNNRFSFSFSKVNTPDCPNLYYNSGIPVISKNEISEKFPECSIYEIMQDKDSEYVINRF